MGLSVPHRGLGWWGWLVELVGGAVCPSEWQLVLAQCQQTHSGEQTTLWDVSMGTQGLAGCSIHDNSRGHIVVTLLRIVVDFFAYNALILRFHSPCSALDTIIVFKEKGSQISNLVCLLT